MELIKDFIRNLWVSTKIIGAIAGVLGGFVLTGYMFPYHPVAGLFVGAASMIVYIAAIMTAYDRGDL